MLLEQLQKETGLRRQRLVNFSETASRRYFVFPVQKRNGEKRWIAHPARPLKALQRWLNDKLFSILRVHDSAMAYRKGVNIRQNAQLHANYQFTLRIDFSNFFPSFAIEGVRLFLLDERSAGRLSFSDDDLYFILNLVLRYDELSIGAPSSPILTNAMMYNFDCALDDMSSSKKLVYTRYADDIFISSNRPFILSEVCEEIRSFVEDFKYANLKINDEKTVYLSRKYKRSITGLIITPQGRVSIGRKRKREIRALLFEFENSRIAIDDISRLRGLLSFVSDVEPDFIESLRRKYGSTLLERLSRA
jgi:RNA-directed DNA polymerase